MEDWKKKYEDALEKVRKLFEKGREEGLTIVHYDREFEAIFPELKESEDERIIERIKKAVESYWSDEPLDEILAWFEKQEKRKPVISDDALGEGIAHFGITQYQIDNWLKKYVDVEKQGSQILDNSAKTCKDEQKSEEVDNLHDYLYGEKKPTAWSEEDERALNDAIVAISMYANGNIPYILPSQLLEDVEQLKSLKERYTWKPSEQDILLLERLANGKSNPQDFQASLGGLIGELKKLKAQKRE